MKFFQSTVEIKVSHLFLSLFLIPIMAWLFVMFCDFAADQIVKAELAYCNGDFCADSKDALRVITLEAYANADQ